MITTTGLNLYYANKVQTQNQNISDLQKGIEGVFGGFYPWKVDNAPQRNITLPGAPLVPSVVYPNGNPGGGAGSETEQLIKAGAIMLGVMLVMKILFR